MSFNAPLVSLLGNKEVLMVGFEVDVKNPSYNTFFQNHKLKSWEIRSSFAALQWLRERKDWPFHKLPYAILIAYEAMEQEGFQFVKALQFDPRLKELPLIAISKGTELGMDRRSILSAGIDDCYSLPVDWDHLAERIHFLGMYKSQFKKVLSTEEILLDYKIPPGKRVFDIGVASFTLLLLSPLLFLIGILIKIESRGPVIYKSKRVGTGYDTFEFLKFRSMYPDADRRLKDLQHLNKYSENGGDENVFLKLENDPRITKVGRLIRKTSLDELPQLINVLKGDMSIVGNRPLPLYEAQLMTRDQWANRFLAPAGITGLWQVAKGGKDNLSVEERVGLDVKYARESSFWLDVQIMWKTLPAMIQRGE